MSFLLVCDERDCDALLKDSLLAFTTTRVDLDLDLEAYCGWCGGTAMTGVVGSGLK